ncbi:LysR family transcriptional regulator [Celerinatantimonas sp. MCCC 1A17872]|uniref:LysR family transcriptional regulator n=1 Tax=Celerinatantimonas sp. MCCC 1A17872 TaxID=3177514 RepID=UPI0038BED9BE
MHQATNYSLKQMSDYELKQLRVFKTVVECGGFAAAETKLNIGRSTISSHISNLESRLNLRLCQRGRAGFALTEEGAIIFAMTQEVLDSLEKFRNGVNNLNSSLTGQLRILMSDNICLDSRANFPELVASYAQKAPQVQLITDIRAMADIEQRLLNHEADIGFIPYHRELEGLSYQQLYADTCYLYCALNHPLSQKALSGTLSEQAIDLAPAAHAELKAHEQVNNQLINLNLTAAAYFYDVRLSLILSGNYIGFLPEFYAQHYVSTGQIIALNPQTRHYQLGVAAVCRKTAQPHKPRELFWQLLTEQLGKHST